jgi:hypothetical protein
MGCQENCHTNFVNSELIDMCDGPVEVNGVEGMTAVKQSMCRFVLARTLQQYPEYHKLGGDVVIDLTESEVPEPVLRLVE